MTAESEPEFKDLKIVIIRSISHWPMIYFLWKWKINTLTTTRTTLSVELHNGAYKTDLDVIKAFRWWFGQKCVNRVIFLSLICLPWFDTCLSDSKLSPAPCLLTRENQQKWRRVAASCTVLSYSSKTWVSGSFWQSQKFKGVHQFRVNCRLIVLCRLKFSTLSRVARAYISLS